jgi:pSer/pThr/pTyr-binding forkhead associated (FHA) protein
MPELIISYSDKQSETLVLNRLRTTIGRSARSDVCIPDAFASRLHAEVRQEGDGYWLQDLGSANGTKYNGSQVTLPLPLTSGGEIQIGETRIVFHDNRTTGIRNATLIADNTEALNPANTIAFSAKKNSTSDIINQNASSRSDLLGLISKVGVTLLASTGLDETLQQVASLVFEAVPADRCVIMLRDEKGAEKLRIAVARVRGSEETLDEVRVSRTVIDEVITNGKSVLTSDA